MARHNAGVWERRNLRCRHRSELPSLDSTLGYQPGQVIADKNFFPKNNHDSSNKFSDVSLMLAETRSLSCEAGLVPQVLGQSPAIAANPASICVNSGWALLLWRVYQVVEKIKSLTCPRDQIPGWSLPTDCNLLNERSVTTLDYVCIGSLWINIVQLKHIFGQQTYMTNRGTMSWNES